MRCLSMLRILWKNTIQITASDISQFSQLWISWQYRSPSLQKSLATVGRRKSWRPTWHLNTSYINTPYRSPCSCRIWNEARLILQEATSAIQQDADRACRRTLPRYPPRPLSQGPWACWPKLTPTSRCHCPAFRRRATVTGVSVSRHFMKSV